MAKQQVAETLSPLSVGVGAVVASDAFRRASALLNYVAGRRPQVHVCFGATIRGGSEHAPIDLYFDDTASGWLIHAESDVYVDPDAILIDVGVRFNFPVSNTGRVRITLGGSSVTINGTSATNGAETATSLAVSATGTGWQLLRVELERLTGTGEAYVRNLSIQDVPITTAASLPDPAND